MGRRYEHTREQIRGMALAAAADIVRRDGRQALTARAVAARIGYTVGSLYVVFENLDALVAAVNEASLRELATGLGRAAAHPGPPLQRLRRMVEAYVDFARREPDLWRLVFEHRLPAGQADPTSIDEQTAAIFALLTGVLGAIDPRASRSELQARAAMIWSGVHGACVLDLDGKLHRGSRQSVRTLALRLAEVVAAPAGAEACRGRDDERGSRP